MSLNIANNFYERSRESENVLKKVYTRIIENEYVTLKLDNQFSSEKKSNDFLSSQISIVKKSISKISAKLSQVNEVHDEANSVFNLLRIHHVKVELIEIHNTWLYVLKYYVFPSIMKLKTIGDEANKNSDFNLCKKLAYFNVIEREVELLNDGMNQFNCIFKLALMQIVSTDQFNSRGLYLNEVNHMEE